MRPSFLCTSFVLTLFVASVAGCKGRAESGLPHDNGIGGEAASGDGDGDGDGSGGGPTYDGELIVDNGRWGMVYELFIDGEELYYVTDADDDASVRMRPKRGPFAQGERIANWNGSQSMSFLRPTPRPSTGLRDRGSAVVIGRPERSLRFNFPFQ